MPNTDRIPRPIITPETMAADLEAISRQLADHTAYPAVDATVISLDAYRAVRR